MSDQSRFNLHCGAPSVQDRIISLDGHDQLYDTIAEHPRVGIYQRFGRQWAFVLPYIEGEVYKSWRNARTFVQKNARTVEEAKKDTALETKFQGVMNDLVDRLILDSRAFSAFREMALAPPPSMLSMEEYRANSISGEEGTRAANGEMSSIYGKEKEPIPSGLTTLHDEDLEPITQFLVDRAMNPFVTFVGKLRNLRVKKALCFWKRQPDLDTEVMDTEVMDTDRNVVNARTMTAVARAMLSVMAITSLVAPIAILNAVEQPWLRILIVALFAQAFATSIEFVGTRSVPLYMLIAAYFQIMVTYLGTTSEQKIRQ